MTKEDCRRKVRKEAERLIDEESIERILKAAGARRIEDDARRVFKALAEESICQYALDIQEVAEDRAEKTVNAECVACGAARSRFSR